jgi:hypothetical protein
MKPVDLVAKIIPVAIAFTIIVVLNYATRNNLLYSQFNLSNNVANIITQADDIRYIVSNVLALRLLNDIRGSLAPEYVELVINVVLQSIMLAELLSAFRKCMSKGWAVFFSAGFILVAPLQNLYVGYQYELGIGTLTLGLLGITLASLVLLTAARQRYLRAAVYLILLGLTHPINGLIAAPLLLIPVYKKYAERIKRFSILIFVCLAALASALVILKFVPEITEFLAQDKLRFVALTIVNSSGSRGGFFFPWLDPVKINNFSIISLLTILLLKSRSVNRLSSLESTLNIALVYCLFLYLIAIGSWWFSLGFLSAMGLTRVYAYTIPLIYLYFIIRIVSLEDKKSCIFAAAITLLCLTIKSPCNVLFLAALFSTSNHSNGSRNRVITILLLIFLYLVIRISLLTHTALPIGKGELLSFLIFAVTFAYNTAQPSKSSARLGSSLIATMCISVYLAIVLFIGYVTEKQLAARLMQAEVSQYVRSRILPELDNGKTVMSASGMPFYNNLSTASNTVALGFGVYSKNLSGLLQELSHVLDDPIVNRRTQTIKELLVNKKDLESTIEEKMISMEINELERLMNALPTLGYLHFDKPNVIIALKCAKDLGFLHHTIYSLDNCKK